MDQRTLKIMLVVLSKGWACMDNVSVSILLLFLYPLLNLIGCLVVHSLGLVYQFSSDFYSMTAGSLLDMYLISCHSLACAFELHGLLTLIYIFLNLLGGYFYTDTTYSSSRWTSSAFAWPSTPMVNNAR